jgi:hypothetical protein
MKKWAPWILATIFALIIYHIKYGLATLQPSNISWLMSVRHDWGTHYLGWAFFKSEPWHFPIGKITGYNYPVGTNVGFTDSIPLLAIFFKLFAPLLPDDFQYFGIWLFLCHLLAGYFTILLFRLFKINWIITLAAVVFVVTNPVLIYRGMHPALCAHWLLIGSIYIYFLGPHTTGTNKILLFQFFLLTLSALINPYMCGMVLGLTFATTVRLCFFDKVLRKQHFFAYLAACLFSVLLLWYLTGLVEFGGKEDLGVGGAYGLYSLNLNALFDPGGYSSILPKLKHMSPLQYEGYMYLGFGMLLLLSLFLFYRGYIFIQRRMTGGKSAEPAKTAKGAKSVIPLLALATLYAIFSITLVFTFNDRVLFRLPAPSFFVNLEEIFRASARFFWTPYYLIILFTIIGIAKTKINPLITSSVILLALIVQLYDIKLLLMRRNLTYGSYTPPMDNKSWLLLMSQFDEILAIPPFYSPAIRPMDYQDFCYLALKAGKPINMAYVARSDSRAMRRYSDSLTEMVQSGRLSPKALYITDALSLEQFSLALQSGAGRLNALDGCYYIFSKDLKNEAIDSLTKKLNALQKGRLDSAINSIAKRTEFVKAGKIPVVENKSINYNLESIKMVRGILTIHGWAVEDSTPDNSEDSVFVFLSSGDKTYWASTVLSEREDIARAYPKSNIHHAGFNLFAFTDSVQMGRYHVGIFIRDAHGRYVKQTTGTDIKVKLPEFAIPENINRLPVTGTIRYDLNLNDKNAEFDVSGWAALENQDADSCTIRLVLKGKEHIYAFVTESVHRQDVTAAFKNKYKLDNSGYLVEIAKDSLAKDKYQFGILIRDLRNNSEKIMMTDHAIDIR